jgi:hypothetical protein
MKDWIISVNNHTYSGERIYIDNCIKAGKEAMKGKNAIIAVEKGNIVQLLSIPHKNRAELQHDMAQYVMNGFKVYVA